MPCCSPNVILDTTHRTYLRQQLNNELLQMMKLLILAAHTSDRPHIITSITNVITERHSSTFSNLMIMKQACTYIIKISNQTGAT